MPSRRSLEVRLYQAGAVLAATVATVVVLGVGCSDSKKTVAPSNTIPNNSGTPVVEGWQDATVPAAIDETQACTRYQRAVCERKNECGLATDDCAKAVANCPDYLFSPGSTRDKKKTWECAFAMRERSCQDVYTLKNPDCVTPGTKKVGEPCVTAAQCESLACSYNGVDCGACMPRVGQGVQCMTPEGKQTAACEPGLKCDSATKICAELPAKSFDDVASTGLPVGATCNARSLCATSVYCKYNDKNLGTCTQKLAEGEACTTSKACIEGTYCYQEGNTCRKFPEIGKRCGHDVETGNAIACTEDAYCDIDTSQCKPLPLADEPCAADMRSDGPILCAANATCDNTVEPPICKALGAAGDRCTSDAACQNGLRCLCGKAATPDADAGTDTDAGADAGADADTGVFPSATDGEGETSCTDVCTVIRDVGESCANPGELCNAASTCSDGVCQSNPSQQLYATTCAN